MQVTGTCTECGALIATETGQNLCPRCLLGLALEAGHQESLEPEPAASEYYFVK